MNYSRSFCKTVMFSVNLLSRKGSIFLCWNFQYIVANLRSVIMINFRRKYLLTILSLHPGNDWMFTTVKGRRFQKLPGTSAAPKIFKSKRSRKTICVIFSFIFVDIIITYIFIILFNRFEFFRCSCYLIRFLMSLITVSLVSKRLFILSIIDNIYCMIKKQHKLNSKYTILTKN
jgi:branched-subunit amino acid transport protein